MSFKATLDVQFPGAAPEAEVTRAVAVALEPLGFDRSSAMACIASCRDEVSQPWADAVEREWGSAFNLAGLAGVTPAGVTGVGAALAHAPVTNGRERCVFYAGPHVGIGASGEPGVCQHDGRPGPSAACGALAAVLQTMRDGGPLPDDDPDDLEFATLRRRLFARADGRTPDLFGLTIMTHELIAEDLDRLLSRTVDTSKTDYAVASGIQIHAPGGVNLTQLRVFYAVVDGRRRELEPHT